METSQKPVTCKHETTQINVSEKNICKNNSAQEVLFAFN